MFLMNVAYVAWAIYVYCKCVVWMLHIFHTYVVFYLDVAYVFAITFQVFSSFFASVSYAYFKCFICLQKYDANV
jgi:hypothetical protein